MRFEVTGPLGVAVFCDMGDVSPNQHDLRWDHLHLSCGSGVRYDTPVGPIRLDVGVRIPGMQVLGMTDAQVAANPIEGAPPGLFNNWPMALSFGIGETY